MSLATNAAYTAAWLDALVRVRQSDGIRERPLSTSETPENPSFRDHLERALRHAGAAETSPAALREGTGTHLDRLI